MDEKKVRSLESVWEGEEDIEDLCAAWREQQKALVNALMLIEELGAGPLDLAVRYGPDYEPPTREQLGEMRDSIAELLSEEERERVYGREGSGQD